MRVVQILENLTNQQEPESAAGINKPDDDEELFLGLELPLVITGWIIVFVTYVYLMFNGM